MPSRKGILTVARALLLGAAPAAQATTIVLGSCFTGACSELPSDYQVYLTVTDGGAGLQVGVSVAPSTGVGDVSSVYLSFVGSATAADWAGPSGALVRFPAGRRTASGSFSYDVELDFHPPRGKGSAMLHPGDSATFTIAGLTASSFDGAIAHVQRLGPDGEGSVHINVPDAMNVPDAASSASLLGLGLVVLGLVRRRTRP